MEFKKIERKWQKAWEDAKLFEVNEKSKKKKFYLLEMFPYPSGEGLHMGHALNFVIGDVFARKKIMDGFNVLHPMGYDALGLPAENAAIKAGTHPQEYTDKAIKNYISQQKSLGITYDWTRIVNTADPNYYKWDQWIFLKMFEKGLVYQKESAVNWCPKCNTVLANEQVQNGKCWRHDDTDVEVKSLKQWFLKITDYANELYEDIDKLEGWPSKTKAMQKNWIGKSHGTEIDFEINGENWPVFTTRPDTIFGVTFMVVSAQHTKLFDLVTKEQKKEVESFLKKLKSVSEKELENMEKEGVFTGSYAINPINGEKIPVWAGNFVLADYGSGMVMAVPAHDQRDFEFAKKYKIEIRQVIAPEFITDAGADAFNPKKEIVKRKAIFAIVKHWKEDKYFCLDWKKFNWNTVIIGGIEDGESAKEAAIREVKEETGYQEIKSINQVGFDVFSRFFATHKGVNRETLQKTFLVELGSDKHAEPDSEHVENHDGLWIPKKDVEKFLNIPTISYIWNTYLKGDVAYTGGGQLINSKQFNEMNNKEAIDKITAYLKKQKKGRKVINFKLRDWGISRQRYWGTPIPMVHCKKCGVVPVKEKDLPIVLPKNVKFGKGNPLESNEKWIKTKCPKCGGEGRREIDTMDTFVNSSWYQFRYADPNNNKEIFDKKKVAYWCPIDQYIGGAEHTCMHLIYFRFYTKFLADLGLIKFREPAKKLFHQGLLMGEGGVKMSKSKGNVVNPEAVSEKYGIDTARLFLLSLAAPDKPRDWDEKGIQGSLRIIQRIFDYFTNSKFGKDDKRTLSKLNKTIKEVSEDIDSFAYNLAIIKIRQLFDHVENETISKDTAEKFLKMFSIFCPHVSEELWEKIGNKPFVSNAKWPKVNEKLIDESLEKIEAVVDTLRQDILKIKELAKIEKVSKVKVFVAPEWKWKALAIVKKACGGKPDFGIAMKSLMSNNEMKKQGKAVQNFLKAVMGRFGELQDLEKFDEAKTIGGVRTALEKEFGKIEIIKAEGSQEAKAKNAFPGKPALLVE